MLEVVRKGKADGGRALLNDEQRAEIDAYCKRELQHLGSDVPFDDFFRQGLKIDNGI